MPTKTLNPPAAPRKLARKPIGKLGRKPTARLDFRLPAEAREKIEMAAHHVGMSLDDFAATALLERAESVLEEPRVTRLNAEQWERFEKIMANPPPPTEAMQRLMRAGAKYSWRDENGVTHFDPLFDEELTDEDMLDPH